MKNMGQEPLKKPHKLQVAEAKGIIFPMIPLTREVVDNLHMFLRVGDTLIDMLISTLQILDRINQSLYVRSLTGLTHLATFENTVRELGICGYSF